MRGVESTASVSTENPVKYWFEHHPGLVTLILLLVLTTAGILLMTWKSSSESTRGLGAGMISGAVVTLALFFVQLSIDDAKNQAADNAKQAAARQAQLSDNAAFRLAVSLQNNLTGFDYTGHSMQGFYLSGKILRDADLAGVDLQHATLHSTDMSYADLGNADLRGANAHGASFANASLVGADLRKADLRNATLRNADLHGAQLAGAVVDADTCWPSGFLTRQVRLEVRAEPVVHFGRVAQPASAGHVCTAHEATPR